MHVHCPHCHNPLELVDDAEFSNIQCPSCGSSFSLLEETITHQKAEAKTIGHFELLEQVGLGAFGSVWKARDTTLDRTVAVKIPRTGQLDATETEHFLREARSAAQLKHSNIVTVYEVGREDGQTYIVSDFVEGLPLSSWLTGRQLTFREAAELVAKVAEALHHAHEAGVIHRDLKPSNIMLDAEGEPHIMDFGLAKREAGEITMTVDGKVLGTPAYMSPEQAQGQAHAADRRTDVYSLGVILFELLTGERPFRGDYRMLLHQVIYDEAPRLRKLNSTVPRSLEAVCMKCLQKQPTARYATAAEFAQDLRRWLSNEPVRARPVGDVGRLVRATVRQVGHASKVGRAGVRLVPVLLGIYVLAVVLTIPWWFVPVSAWRFLHIPIHTALETTGAFLGFTTAAILVALRAVRLERGSHVWIASALIGMGVMDGAHSVLQVSEAFVWLRCSATFVGGLLFAMVSLPRSWGTPSWWLLPLVFVAVSLFVASSLFFHGSIPPMLEDGSFSLWSRGISVAGGLLFLTAALSFFVGYLRNRVGDDLTWMLQCVLFATPALLIEQCQLWDPVWWSSHVFRLMAYSTPPLLFFIATLRQGRGTSDERWQYSLDDLPRLAE